ncbi:MAG: CBS domain-containing protein [Beijerinckiaceae bacterium]
MTVATIIATKGRDVASAAPHHTLAEVSEVLASRRIGALLVMGSDGELKGIVSERDIVRAIAKSGAAALEEPVSQHMTAKVITCEESDLISAVMGEMTRGRFRHMPVVNGKKVVGVISIGDVVKQRIAEAESESRLMREYIQMAS